MTEPLASSVPRILTGSGAYEGLTAVLQVDFGSSFAGVIFEGEVPSAPPAPEG